MQRQLNLFNEQDTVNDMGLSPIRDAISVSPFPGIKSLQTRLSCVLFSLGPTRNSTPNGIAIKDLKEVLWHLEVNLIKAVAEDGETGVLFARVLRRTLKIP